MEATPLPVADGSVLVVIGSENWNPADRSLGRDAIHSVQLFEADRSRLCPGLDPLGPHGLRDALLLDPSRALLSSGYDLVSVDLRTGQRAAWPLDRFSDLHELSLAGDRVLVANTKHDELIELDLDGTVTARTSLDPFRHERAQPIAHNRRLGGAIGERATHEDHFHLNQAFLDHDGHRCVVVHHSRGFQPVQHLRHRLTGHGDGGVIDLDGGETHRLGLRAPHSVRRVDDGYVVLDSGRRELVRYDRAWREVVRYPTPGWGRGLAISADGTTAFAGISATRRRYLAPGERAGENLVVAIDLRSGAELGRRRVAGVEQLWTVALWDEAPARALSELVDLVA